MTSVNTTSGLGYASAATSSAANVWDKKIVAPDPDTLKISPATLERIAHEKAEVVPQDQAQAASVNIAALRQQQLAETRPISTTSSAAVDTGILALQDFYAHSRVDAKTLTNALSAVFATNTGGGDNVSRSIDLSMTQAKLEHIAQNYLDEDFQGQAQNLINNYISASSNQNEAVNKAIYTAAVELAESLGDVKYASESRAALKSLEEGTHISQKEHQEIFTIAATTPDMNERLGKFAQYIQKNENSGFFLAVKKEHLATVSQQWADFIHAF